MAVRKPYVSYLTGKRALEARKKVSLVVRLFHPRGQYPKGQLGWSDGLYWADEQIAFCVTRTRLWPVRDDDSPYTEMDWLTQDELRLLASVLFCEEWEGQKILFYPVHHYSPILNRSDLDLADPRKAELIRQAVIWGLNSPQYAHNAIELRDCQRLRYSLIDPENVDLGRHPDYWVKIDRNNSVLIRGVSALLKADMLSRYPEFFEEAATACFISLEASFQLILKHLKSRGAKNPSAKDAALWLHTEFDQHLGFPEPLEKYFHEFYDQRVMTFHPASRFGEFPYPPLAHDDYYHLRGSLRSIFAYLVSGVHDRGFLQEIQQRSLS